MELKDVLQQMIAQTVQAGSPTDISIGTVKRTSPLEISINPQMAPLRAPVLSLTWAVVSHTVKLPTVTIPGAGQIDLGSVEITESLKAGDKVIMLRVQNGQKFIVLSKVEGG